MESSTTDQITTPGDQNFFLSPQFPMQRQYEALRAYLVEEESSHRRRPPLRLFPPAPSASCVICSATILKNAITKTLGDARSGKDGLGRQA